MSTTDASPTPPSSTSSGVTARYLVGGMTCGHCVSSVTEELSELSGVTAVSVDLHPQGVSAVFVTSEAVLAESAVAAAITEAGYELADVDR